MKRYEVLFKAVEAITPIKGIRRAIKSAILSDYAGIVNATDPDHAFTQINENYRQPVIRRCWEKK